MPRALRAAPAVVAAVVVVFWIPAFAGMTSGWGLRGRWWWAAVVQVRGRCNGPAPQSVVPAEAGAQCSGWMGHGVWRAPGVAGCPGRGGCGGRGFLDSGLRRNDERVGLAGTVVVGAADVLLLVLASAIASSAFGGDAREQDDLDFFGDFFLAGAVAAAGEVFELLVDALAGLFHVLKAELVFVQQRVVEGATERGFEKLVDQRCM